MEAETTIPDRGPTRSPGATARRFQIHGRAANSVRCAMRLWFAGRGRSQAVWPSRRDRIPGMRQRASAAGAARDLSHRGDQETCSWRRRVCRNGTQMVVPPGEGDERFAGVLGGYPYGAITLPFPCENILGEPAKQVGRQCGLFQREGMKGAWNDDERAVRNPKTQGLVE